jgi:hypothetical protein
MRSMKSVGIELRSTDELPGTPETKRLPFTRTSVRSSPRLRRSITATPEFRLSKFEFVRLKVGNEPKAGFFSRRS